MAKPVLITGASGNLGRAPAAGLAARKGRQGRALVLTDLAPFPGALPPGARFERADLGDGAAILRLAEGCGHILHCGGVRVERPFEEVLGPNLRGLYHVYEAARREGARVTFASSNHTIGFHERPGEPRGERDVPLAADCAFRPDGYYGLSKAYGELMGRLFRDKHGVENVNLRIGSCFPEPVDVRMLSTWRSYADLLRLVARCVDAERVGHAVVWGCSANPASWWGEDHRARLGWAPEDSAEAFREQVGALRSGSEVAERHQGGMFCAQDFTRTEPPPSDPFAAQAAPASGMGLRDGRPGWVVVPQPCRHAMGDTRAAGGG